MRDRAAKRAEAQPQRHAEHLARAAAPRLVEAGRDGLGHGPAATNFPARVRAVAMMAAAAGAPQPDGGGRNSPNRRAKNPPAGATLGDAGADVSGSGRTGIERVAAAMKLRQVWAGTEPPTTRFIGALLSLPNHTPVTRSAV